MRSVARHRGAVYAIERLDTEGWKSILREQDQTRYTIPMRLGFRGQPLNHIRIRYTAGAVLGSGTIASLVELNGIARAIRAAGGYSSPQGQTRSAASQEGLRISHCCNRRTDCDVTSVL